MRALWTQARADAAGLMLLALAVLATSVLASVIPRQVSATAQAALVAAVAEAPAPAREVRATYAGSAGARGLAATGPSVVAAFPPELAGLVGDPHVSTSTGDLPAVPADGTAPRSPQVRLVVRAQSDLARAATWVEGSAPRGVVGTATTVQGELPLAEVGLSTDAARAVDLSVGDVLVVSGSTENDRPADFLAVRVTGLFTAVDAAGWEGAGPVFSAYPEVGETGNVVAEQVVAVTDPTAVDALVPLGRLSTAWRYPVDLSRLRAEDVDAVDAAMNEATTVSIAPPRGTVAGVGSSTRIRVVSGLPDLLADYRADVAGARSLAAITTLGLGAIAAAVLALAALQLSTRRARAVALARSRGFSLVQVLTATAPPAALLVLIGAALGLGAGALLVPGQPWTVPIVLVAIVAAGAVVAAVATTVADYRRGAQVRAAPVHPARRLTAETVVAIAAVVGVVLLQRRGLAGSGAGGVDPYLALVPVLLALSAALAALRMSPLPLAVAARAARAGRGAAAFVGLSSAQRTTRSGPVAAAALVVLVVALAFSVFASALSTTVARGQERASWERVGADLSVAGSGLDDDVVRAVSAVPGVRAVVPVFRDDTATLSPGAGQPTPVVVLALDPADYASARADGTSADDVAELRRLSSTPTPAGTVPALVAPTGGTATYSGPATLTLGAGLGQVGVEVVGTSTAVPAPRTSAAPVLLVPAAALAEAVPDAALRSPGQLLVMAGPAAAEKVAAGLDATLDVTLRAAVLADLDAQPLVTGTRAILRLGVLVAAGYALLTVTLTLVAGARERGWLLSVLRTLGLRRRSARLLLAAELAPLVVLAVVSGAAAGLALLPATAPALDLRPYTGGQADPALAVESAHVLALAAATAVLVTVATVVTVRLDRRRQLGTALRVGGTP